MNLAPEATAALIATRVSLGVLFLPSALRKVMDYARFREAVVNYRVLPAFASRIVAATVPAIELLVAATLVLGVLVLLSAGLAMAMLAIFSVAVFINLVRGRIIPCGCYSMGANPLIGWGTIARNSTLIVLAGVVVGLTSTAAPVHDRSSLVSLDMASVSVENIMLLVAAVAGLCVLVSLFEWGVEIYWQGIRHARHAQLRTAGHRLESDGSGRLEVGR